ncbi:hypothetical protein ACT7DH_25010 [Bacillus pacificus]
MYYAKTLEEHNALKQKYITKKTVKWGGIAKKVAHPSFCRKIYRVKNWQKNRF